MGKLIYLLGAVILVQLYTIDSAPIFPLMTPGFSGFMPLQMGIPSFNLPFLNPLLSVLPLLRELPPYILKMVIHNSNVFVFPSKRLNPTELGYLAYLFHKQNISSFYVVYNYVSLDTPITIPQEELPLCSDACPINADKISKPTATPSSGPPDATFIPPNAGATFTPPAPVPISPTPITPPLFPQPGAFPTPLSPFPTQVPSTGPQPALFPTPPLPFVPSIPSPVQTNGPQPSIIIPTLTPPLPSISPITAAPLTVPQGPTSAAIPTVPAPAIPVPPTPETQTESGLKLSLFAKNLVPLILSADYRGVRRIVNAEFTSGMLKLQTDLARLKLRKQVVVNKTSADDEKLDDLAYLDGIVGDAEKVLVDKYNDRKQLFLKDINHMTIQPAFRNIGQREAEFVADRFDRIVHDPIAESKKILNSSRKDINEKMLV